MYSRIFWIKIGKNKKYPKSQFIQEHHAKVLGLSLLFSVKINWSNWFKFTDSDLNH